MIRLMMMNSETLVFVIAMLLLMVINPETLVFVVLIWFCLWLLFSLLTSSSLGLCWLILNDELLFWDLFCFWLSSFLGLCWLMVLPMMNPVLRRLLVLFVDLVFGFVWVLVWIEGKLAWSFRKAGLLVFVVWTGFFVEGYAGLMLYLNNF